ncbi:MAG TPA: hypothetical protein VIE38_01850 [Gaiellaceae bacterium]|jgi:hypothetical protein
MIMAPACSTQAAMAAIVRQHPKVKDNANEMVPVDPKSIDGLVCTDDTMAIALASGGTAGDVGFVLFHRTSSGWRVARTEGGYKIGVFKLGGDVQVVQPIYRFNDPNCCPTGGFEHVRFHWNGSRFVVGRSWHTRNFRP